MSRSRSFAEILGRVLSILGLIFVFKVLWDSAPGLGELSVSKYLPALALVGALFFFVQILVSSWIWQRLLGEERIRLRFDEAFIICSQSQIAKYIPGNIFQYVDRNARALTRGVSLDASLGATFLEILLVSVSGALLGSYAIFFGPAGAALAQAGLPGWRGALGVLVAGGLLLAVLARRYGERARAVLSGVPKRTLVFAVLIYTGFFIGYGVLLALLIAELYGDVAVSAVDLTTGFALGWVAGFAVPGAPGGIGVREFVLQQIFGGSLGQAQAALLFLLIRLLGVFGEIAAFLVATALKNGWIPLTPRPGPAE